MAVNLLPEKISPANARAGPASFPYQACAFHVLSRIYPALLYGINMHPIDRPRFALFFIALTSFFTLLLWLFLPAEVLIYHTEEGRIVEQLTLYAYGLAIFLLLVLPVPTFKPLTRYAVIVVLLTMMAREADLHKAVADMSMIKLRFWTGNLPLHDKLIAFGFLAPAALACLWLLFKQGRATLRAVKQRIPHAISIVSFIALIALTNLLDRSLGIVKEWLGWHAPHWLVALQTSQEEFLELALPVLAVIALLQYRRSVMYAQKACLLPQP
ncbi:hypothetical protein C7M51_01829 [Mixta intestinalis]|uniref:Uncharacterized protein n=2 Tax=Mixta intestinalis TaxID=1615494 RepID=A0A6P1Q0A0_9GAMM|nr:hypothetical protein C7M51_01829 [Mixta intestinalis]